MLFRSVTGCDGTFERGDVVHVVTQSGRRLASGMANYGSAEVAQILGRHSDQIADVLGYELGAEVIHRNNLVLV